jgi:hypothetical protein
VKPIGQLNTTHPMYQPDRRAPRVVRRALIPDRNGSHEEKQLWMRERQERLKAKPPRKPATREPRSPIVKLACKLKPCQCSLDQIVERLANDPELRAILNQEPPKWSEPTK